MFKITIIIPITDYAEYDDATFESIKNQTIGFDNLQVLYVKSSSDNIVNNHSQKYPNVVSVEINEIDSPKGKLNNIGIENSVSDYLMFLNPSDKLMEDACESLYNKILENDGDIACGTNIIGEINNESHLKFDSVENALHLIKNLNISGNLFKKSFITSNLQFLEDIYECDSVFLFDALLNTEKIKLVNKKIVTSNFPQEISKKMLKGLLDAIFEMYYISYSKDSPRLFTDNILFDKLNYFINCLLKCKLSVNDVLGLLVYSKPLFNLLNQSQTIDYDDLSPLFEYIPQEKYDDAMCLIYGENIPKQNEIKMAALCDSYTYDSFKYECDLVNLTSDNWLNQMKNEKPDLFLLTSNYEDFNENEVSKILDFCSKKNITTVFWENSAFKQDLLTKIIFNFDYIFTSFKDNLKHWENCHENVEYLMFATQPMLFNPMNEVSRVKNSVIFIGTWDKKDSEKCRLMSESLNEIISRNYKLNIFDYDPINHSTENTFPARYNNYLNTNESPSIPKIYKESERGLVINENENVIDSNIFELMSSNTIVHSNYKNILYEQFNNNIQYSNCDYDKLDELNLEKIKKENLHNVLKNHTYSDRFKQILDSINFKYLPNITRMILFYNLTSLKELNHVYNHFNAIEYPYKQIRIIATEDLLYLPNTLSETELSSVELGEHDYFSFVDLNLNSDFVEEALLHFSYIEKDIGIKEDINKNFIFDKTDDVRNVIFNSSQFKKVISNENETFDIYCFNNYATKVSVIISIYNGENHLRECLDSVVNQTLKDIEIFCIDNGSYDSSLDIIKEYAQNDSRIRAITQINKGRGGAMNTGLEIANGKYIYFMDSNDLIEQNGLKEMYQQAELKNLDLLKFDLAIRGNEFETKKKPEFLKEQEDGVFDYEKIGFNVYTIPPDMASTFFKVKTIKNIRFPERLKFEDKAFFIEALFNSKRVGYYDNVLANKIEMEFSPLELPGRDFPDIIEITNQIIFLAKKYNHYADYKDTIYSRKYMFIKNLFLQTFENYKKRFFERIKEDCINKKEEYENEKIFEILDEKSTKIFYAGLNSNDYKEFECIIKSI